MKRFITMMLVVVLVLAMATVPVDAKKKTAKAKASVVKVVKTKSVKKAPKGIKIKKIECPCCGDGTSHDCVYWCNFNGVERHMTPAEIEDFLFTESYYQTEDGEWHER